MHEETWLTQMMLMFVGAGPASTGGGIKVTTMFVLFLFITSEARGVPDTVAFGRRIPVESVRQGFSIAFLAMNAVVVGTLVMMLATATSVRARAVRGVLGVRHGRAVDRDHVQRCPTSRSTSWSR